MPLTKTGKKVKAAMEKEYGKEKGERVFYATAHSKGKQWHHSPDEYNPTALGETPPRLAYKNAPSNLHQSETAQKAGSARGNIQQQDGTGNLRADYKTKSAKVPEPSGGKTRWPDVSSYNDSGELP